MRARLFRAVIASLVTIAVALASGGTAVAGNDMVTVTVEIFYDGAWHDISADVRDRGKVRLSRGIRNEGYRADPAELTLQINNGRSRVNPDIVGRYSHRNPSSDLYGKIGRNTPIRVTASIAGHASVRGVLEVVRWPTRWDTSGNDVWVSVTAAGILRRLGTPGSSLASPMSRYISASAPIAWWPLETGDGRATVSSPSGLDGGRPLRAEPASAGSHRLSGTVGGATVGPPGAAGAIDVSGGGQLRAPLPAAPGAQRVELAVLFADPVGELDSGQIVRLHAAGTDTVYGLYAGVVAGAELAFDGSDTNSFASAEASVIVDDGAWHHVRIDLSGATSTTYTVAVDGQVVMSGTLSGVSFSPLTEIVVSPTGDVGAVAQVAVWAGSLPDAAASYAAYTGHAGEPAGRRAQRLCIEAGVDLVMVGDPDQTIRMGPQGSGTLLDLLDECAAAEAGGVVAPILTEQRETLGLRWVCRDSLYLTS